MSCKTRISQHSHRVYSQLVVARRVTACPSPLARTGVHGGTRFSSRSQQIWGRLPRAVRHSFTNTSMVQFRGLWIIGPRSDSCAATATTTKHMTHTRPQAPAHSTLLNSTGSVTPSSRSLMPIITSKRTRNGSNKTNQGDQNGHEEDVGHVNLQRLGGACTHITQQATQPTCISPPTGTIHPVRTPHSHGYAHRIKHRGSCLAR